MPNTHRRIRRDETVLSRQRRRCEHEFATSWRQFCRVVGVNTPVGSRDPLAAVAYCKLAADGCVVRSPNPSAVVANSCTLHTADADATRQNSNFVSSASAVCIVDDFRRFECDSH